MGRMRQGQVLPLLEETVLGLEVGTFSPIVETKFGFHIFKRTE